MSERPSLKLKFSRKSTTKVPKQKPQESPPLTTPSASGPKIKLKLGAKGRKSPAPQQPPDPSTSAPSSITKPKPTRKPKPTPKKRALEEDGDSSDEEPSASITTSGTKKLKLTTSAPSGPVFIKSRLKGRAPKRPRGVGYDSEASDREEDPMICEAFALRMAPGDDCDYLRNAIANGNFGKTKEGGADVKFRFLRSDARRACVSIRGTHYAAILVDLPCVIEAMKSWFPKNGWMKSADVCQMLVVLGVVSQEADALNYPLPLEKKERGLDLDEKTWQWAHGLTPPMHWVRQRRFRKRISVRTVMEVEAEVEELLRKDAECVGKSEFTVIEREQHGSEVDSDEEDSQDDAEGDLVDDQDQQQVETPLETIEGEDEEAQAAMAADFERQMAEAAARGEKDQNHEENLTSAGPSFESPAAQEDVSTPASFPATPSAAVTPAAAVDTSSAAEDDNEDEESSDEDEEDMDEDQLERQQEVQRQKEEIADLEDVIKAEEAKLATTGNQLLRRRIMDKIKSVQGDLDLKLAASGQGGEG